MKLSCLRFAIRALVVAFVAAFLFGSASRAQTPQPGPAQTPSMSQVNSMQQELHLLTDVQKQAQEPVN